MIKKLYNLLNKHFFNKEFFSFICIGLINTFNGTILSTIYALVLQPNLAFVCGYLTSLCIAYILNSIFTFKEKLSIIKLVKFAISYIPNFIIQNLVVFLVYNILQWKEIMAYVIAAVLGIPVTFLLLKIFAFAKTENE